MITFCLHFFCYKNFGKSSMQRQIVFQYQHVMAGGRCGICGDPWGAKVKHHEAPGGKYAKGVITGTYKAGSVVPVTVQITANHMGYFVFKMCPNNDPSRDPQQSCFDK